MTTHMPTRENGARGLIGARHLVGVQTFDIARLTNQAIPIVPGTFVAVSGVGPQTDSNGSGKTSFLAAVSVLLADPQWKLSVNGGRHAANLLFKPDAAGLDPAQRISAAPYGYIIGVFASSVDPGADAVTVWVRVSASTPYVEARWSPGMHVADADNDAERILQADTLWQQCGHGKPISARKMAEVLYGDTPRCLTYLDTQMRPRVPSLLSQQMTEMEPEIIGDSLIALAGLDSKLATETIQRGKFLKHEAELAVAVANDVKAREQDEADLAGVVARQEARERIAQGRALWRRYLACRLHRAHDEGQRLDGSASEIQELLDEATGRRDSLNTRLSELRVPRRLAEDEERTRRERNELRTAIEAVRAERANITAGLGHLAKERPRLRSAAAGWSGADVETARERVADQRLEVARTKLDVERANTEVSEAEGELRLAEAGLSGMAGEAIQILAEIDIEGVGVLDVVDPDSVSREAWEARLWPWRHVVAVSDESLSGAAEHLTSRLPGAQLVGVGEGGVEDFLTNLEQQTTPYPGGVVFPSLNAVVIGGFDPPIAGRNARVGAAAQHLAIAEVLLAEAQRIVGVVENLLQLAETDFVAAEATARLAAISAEEEQLNAQLIGIDERLGGLCEREEPVERAWEEAHLAVKSIKADIEMTQVHLGVAVKEVAQQRRALEGVGKQRLALAVNVWLGLWGEGLEAAAEVAGAEQTAPESLKRRAAELLSEALSAFGVKSEPGDDVSPDLRESWTLRESFSDDSDVSGPSVIFDDVSKPLLTRIAAVADNDLVTQTRIAEERERRERLISRLRDEASTNTEVLQGIQEMLERHIEGVLTQISQAYNDLDLKRGGSGASLEFTSIRPEGAGDWRWKVTPRWRRTRTGSLISYRETANGAQVKVQAIQLVLAAMLADSDPHGRVLILDELGNSLGEVNRRDVLTALSRVAMERQVTILGTCQDSVLTDAADHCGHLLWFEHATTAETYNQPTRAWGYDDNGARVELTADWIRRGRPPF